MQIPLDDGGITNYGTLYLALFVSFIIIIGFVIVAYYFIAWAKEMEIRRITEEFYLIELDKKSRQNRTRI